MTEIANCLNQKGVTLQAKIRKMLNKGTKLYSVINNKCPRCQEGDFFEGSNSYNLSNFMKMHKSCPVCDLTYEPEPGYYFGAMYVSYAINVAVFVTVWVACLVLFNEINVWYQVLASVVLGLGLTPVTFRYARLGWINFFVKYDSNAKAAAGKVAANTSL